MASRQTRGAARDPLPMPPLAPAFDRLEDFVAVQSAQRGEITLEAVLLLQEAAGLGAADRDAICERLPALVRQAEPAAVLLGVIVGLLAAQESAPEEPAAAEA